MKPREPEPIAEQDRQDAARRADQARSDAEYLARLARGPGLPPEQDEGIHFEGWDDAEPDEGHDALVNAQEQRDNEEGL